MELYLLGAVLVLTLYIAYQQRRRARPEVDPGTVRSALNETWREMGLAEQVGQIEDHAGDLEDLHRDLEQMLRLPKERGAFGEQQLDVILSDHLPDSMYGLREEVMAGMTPDAHIESSSGTICIDAKFPLDNYEAYLDARDAGDDEEAEAAKRRFRKDVKRQLDKIASDYVRPEDGTTRFALAFIPSEAVYHHLVTEETDMLRSYTADGVQVVSPLTLGQKLELIKADVHARELSERAEEIQDGVQRLESRFEEFGDEWETFYGHVRNAKNKAEDVQSSFEDIESAFHRMTDDTRGDA
jgi:DNA recombination protein RmuC